MLNRNEEEKEANSERWALTYSDMITLLLVLFILMYTMSSVDTEKYKALATALSNNLSGSQEKDGKGPGLGSGDGFGPDKGSTGATSSSTSSKDDSSSSKPTTSSSSSGSSSGSVSSGSSSGAGGSQPADFNELYNVLKKNIDAKGYGDKVIIEKNGSSIHFKFKDSILFFPDSVKMKDEGKSVLQYVSETLTKVNTLYKSVRIEGHTADVGAVGKDNFSSWELSSYRAVAVLEFMVADSGLAQEKMSVAGFSHYSPITNNDTEAGKATNRRVEITVTSSVKDIADKVSSKN